MWVLVGLIGLSGMAAAAPDGEAPDAPDAQGTSEGAEAAPDGALDETIYVYGRRVQSAIARTRPIDRVERVQLERQQPQSTPEALVLSPGVFVQQSGHGQASPYIRGRTGQQVLTLLDGLRLNHALFRKGPNQYLFTVDAMTVDRLEVVRGSASVELGSDALGGAILIEPVSPTLDPTRGTTLVPRLVLRHRTADGERLGRAELDAQLGDSTAVLVGVGGRTVGRLQAGGNAFPEGRAENQQCIDDLTVPCFEADGRTQLGTGFDELTADARIVTLIPDGQITAAAYLYRQYDAPRTDQCPPPEQATGECLVYDEQFRTHAYVRLDHDPEFGVLDRYRVALGYQRQHQRYTLSRPDRITTDDIDTGTENLGRDAVDGIGFTFRARTTSLELANIQLDLRYGVDGSHEWVESSQWIRFAQPPLTREFSRGQYVNGATFTQSGAWLAPSAKWGALRLRGGVRASWIEAASPGDTDSASRPFETRSTPVVFSGGLVWGRAVALLLNVEQGFRAPNLDDLTARQSTGQGYQIENPDLRPEKALTVEAGLGLDLPRLGAGLRGELLGFRQTLTDAIERRLLARDECVLDEAFVDRECRANRAPLTLVNLSGTTEIVGVDARVEFWPVPELQLRTTVAWARGEGDNPGTGGEARIPLSRISPLNGSALVEYGDLDTGLYIGGVFRWATRQDRLSPGDVADARIPPGGTPGFGVVDLWAGIAVDDRLDLGIKLVNVGDARYRIHGSSLYGSGRGVVVTIGLAPLPDGGWSL